MITRGKFVLFDSAVPPLKAGDYELEASQVLTSPEASGLNTETLRSRLRVTSPRYKLPPDQVLSHFPPANTEGAYESRLPQIVIKRRTLPWERAPHRAGDPDVMRDDAAMTIGPEVPYLALVVIAEGEGRLSDESAVSECVTQGVPMPGEADVVKGVYLSVPKSTVDKVFPTVEDLPLLSHVREVNKDDTENAMGDDDGFMAVILANRLPQFDRVACKPVRYMACLISLEGQLHVLPEPTPPTPVFVATAEVFDAAKLMAEAARTKDPDLATMGMGLDELLPAATPRGGPGPDLPMGPGAGARGPGRSERAVRSGAAEGGGSGAGAALDTARHMAAARTGRQDEWQTTTSLIATTAATAKSEEVAFAVRDSMKIGFRIPFEAFIAEPTYRFPVLTHWSFTTSGAGSLDTILQDLHVGLLGTLPGPGYVPPRPVCRPPSTGTAPPEVPAPRLDPEVVETGHVGLPHQTRDGEAHRAWYRGPFVPHATRRAVLDDTAGTVLAHVSEQLRTITPDGREDLSLAVAFETGRLLALSRASVVSALMRWRREQFGAHRTRRLGELVLKDVAFAQAWSAAPRNSDIYRAVGAGLIHSAATLPEEILGTSRPLVDPGRPIDFLGEDPLDDLARGFGLNRSVLDEMLATGEMSKIDAMAVPSGEEPEQERAALHRALDAAVAEVVRAAGLHAEAGAPGRSASEATRRFLDTQALRRNREME